MISYLLCAFKRTAATNVSPHSPHLCGFSPGCSFEWPLMKNESIIKIRLFRNKSKSVHWLELTSVFPSENFNKYSEGDPTHLATIAGVLFWPGERRISPAARVWKIWICQPKILKQGDGAVLSHSRRNKFKIYQPRIEFSRLPWNKDPYRS